MTLAFPKPEKRHIVLSSGKKRYGVMSKCQLEECGKEYLQYNKSGRFCSRRCSGLSPMKKEVSRKTFAKNIKEYWSDPENRRRRAKKLILDTLDVAARAICRTRGACEAPSEDAINCNGSLQWAHIVSRTYHKVRWDEDNCFLLCAAHHYFYTCHDVHWQGFLDRKIGREKYDELKQRALAQGKVDRNLVYDNLLARLRELGNPNIKP